MTSNENKASLLGFIIFMVISKSILMCLYRLYKKDYSIKKKSNG